MSISALDISTKLGWEVKIGYKLGLGKSTSLVQKSGPFPEDRARSGEHEHYHKGGAERQKALSYENGAKSGLGELCIPYIVDCFLVLRTSS